MHFNSSFICMLLYTMLRYAAPNYSLLHHTHLGTKHTILRLLYYYTKLLHYAMLCFTKLLNSTLLHHTHLGTNHTIPRNTLTTLLYYTILNYYTTLLYAALNYTLIHHTHSI